MSVWAKSRNSTRLDRIFGLASAYLGTIALAALTYFEIRSPWVVDAWAVLVFLTILAGRTLKRQVFVAQGLVLALAVFLRAILYNLHAASLAGSSRWEGRIACISVACAIVVAHASDGVPNSALGCTTVSFFESADQVVAFRDFQAGTASLFYAFVADHRDAYA